MEIQSRLNKPRKKNEFFIRRDGGSTNNFLPPPPPPPNFRNPRLPPLPFDWFNIPNVSRVDEFLNKNDFKFYFSNGYVPPAPDPSPLRRFAGNTFPNGLSTAKILSRKNTVGTNAMQTMSGDCLIEELERVIEKEKPKEEIVPDENIFLACQKYQQFLIMKILK